MTDNERDLYDFIRDCADPDREAVALRVFRKLFERVDRPDLVAALELP